MRALRSPRRPQRGPGRTRSPGCGGRSRRGGGAAWRRGGGGPDGSRHCGGRPRAPGGPALAAAARLRHLGRCPHPRAPPRAGRVRRRGAPEVGPRSPRPGSLTGCVFSECVSFFKRIWGFGRSKAGGSLVKLQPYNRIGILLSVEKGHRSRGGGAVPFPRESWNSPRPPTTPPPPAPRPDRETSVLFHSHRLLIAFWTILQKTFLPFTWTWDLEK